MKNQNGKNSSGNEIGKLWGIYFSLTSPMDRNTRQPGLIRKLITLQKGMTEEDIKKVLVYAIAHGEIGYTVYVRHNLDEQFVAYTLGITADKKVGWVEGSSDILDIYSKHKLEDALNVLNFLAEALKFRISQFASMPEKA